MSYTKEIPILDKGFVKYIGHFGDDALIPRIARVSTGSENKGEAQDKKLLHYLYKNLHSSPLEFANITYLIKCPLFVRDQIVRHRMLKVNILSLRYQEATDEFYIPEEWRKQDTKNRQNSIGGENWNPVIYPAEETVDIEARTIYNSPDVTANEVFEGLTKNEYATYQKLVDAGIAKEMARMVLGTNLYTYMYIQGDLNNLTKFFRLRCHEHCQFETRKFAEGMYEIFKELYPWTAECYEKYKFGVIEK